MPILPTVDYSPILSALSGSRDSQQANYSERFKKIQKDEETRQAVTGAIEGVASLAGTVYNGFAQAKMSQAKTTAVTDVTKTQVDAEEDVATDTFGTKDIVPELDENGNPVIGPDGKVKTVITVPKKRQDEWDEKKKKIEEDYKWFPQVKEFALSQLEANKQYYIGNATQFFARQQAGAKTENDKLQLKGALDAAIGTNDPTIFREAIRSQGHTPEKEKLILSAATEEYNVRMTEKSLAEAIRAGGMSAGLAAVGSQQRGILTPEQQAAADREKQSIITAKEGKAQELADLNAQASTGNAEKDAARDAEIKRLETEISGLDEKQALAERDEAKVREQSDSQGASRKAELEKEVEDLIQRGASAPEGEADAIKEKLKQAREEIASIDNSSSSRIENLKKDVDLIMEEGANLPEGDSAGWKERLKNAQDKLDAAMQEEGKGKAERQKANEAEKVRLEQDLARSRAIPAAQDTPETIAKRGEIEKKLSDLAKSLEKPEEIGKGYNEDEQLKLKAFVAEENKRQMQEAAVESEALYNRNSENPDKQILEIASRYKNQDAANVATATMRKIQTTTNFDVWEKQFNIDRDAEDINQLKGSYEIVQSSVKFKGDEATRGVVLSWYEGLLGNAYGKNQAGSKASEAEAENMISVAFDRHKKGTLSGTGLEALINDQHALGKISGDKHTKYINDLTTLEYPSAKPAMDSVRKSVLGILTNGKEPTKPEDIANVSAMEAEVARLIRKRAYDLGGAATPAEFQKIVQDVVSTAGTSLLTKPNKTPWDWFGLNKNAPEQGIAALKLEMQKPESDTIIGLDINGQPIFASGNPQGLKNLTQTLREWETNNLEYRYGVSITATKYAPSPMNKDDITGNSIYTAPDGKQYMYSTKDGKKMEAYTRDNAQSAWKQAPQKEEFNTGFDARYPMPQNIWADNIISSASEAGARRVMPMSEATWNSKTFKEKQEIYAKNKLQAAKK